MRTEAKALGDLLFGQTRSRILALLYGMPDQSFFTRQIARQTGTSAGTVQRELETLSQLGLIERSASGKQVFYQASRKHPAYPELHSLIAKTSGVFHLLRSALAPLAKRITFALVYGSMARGDENAGSDVDLMVIGNVSMDELLAQLTSAERDLGRSINPTVYSPKEFKAKLQEGNHFLKSVMRGEKVLLIGDENDLGKMDRERKRVT
jgi:predicted nucleotidyltransferase